MLLRQAWNTVEQRRQAPRSAQVSAGACSTAKNRVDKFGFVPVSDRGAVSVSVSVSRLGIEDL